MAGALIAMHATQIVAAHASGMQLLDAPAAADATQSEKRLLAARALGFLRFAQTATRALEKRQAVRRKDDLDYPGYVAAMRRPMEDGPEAFKRDWERTHQPATPPTDPPQPRLAPTAAPGGGQHPMHQFAASPALPEAAPARPSRRRRHQRSITRVAAKTPCTRSSCPAGAATVSPRAK